MNLLFHTLWPAFFKFSVPPPQPVKAGDRSSNLSRLLAFLVASRGDWKSKRSATSSICRLECVAIDEWRPFFKRWRLLTIQADTLVVSPNVLQALTARMKTSLIDEYGPPSFLTRPSERLLFHPAEQAIEVNFGVCSLAPVRHDDRLEETRTATLQLALHWIRQAVFPVENRVNPVGKNQPLNVPIHSLV